MNDELRLDFGSLSCEDLLSTLKEEAIVVGLDRNVLHVNLAVLKRLGVTSRQTVGQHCRSILCDSDGACDETGEECPVRMVQETGKPVSVLKRQVNSGGYRCYLEITALPMRNPEGNLASVLCLPRELGLEDRYQRIFDSMKEGVAVITPTGKLVDVNPALCEMLGYQKKELATKKATDFVPADLATFWAESAARGQPRFETQILRKNKSFLQIEATVSPLRLGLVTLYVAILSDVSRKKLWEATLTKQALALSESAAQYQALFDSSADVLMVIEEDTTIAMVNRRFEEMTAYSRAEVEGKMSFLSLVAEGDRQRMLGIHRLRKEKPTEILPRHSTWIIGKNGKKWLAEVSGVIIPNIGRSLLDARDTTESHQLQEEILIRNREMGALISVTREMVSTLDLQAVLDRTLAIVCTQIGASRGFLCLMDEEKGELRATTFWGDGASESEVVWKVGEGIIGWVAQHQQAVVWDDVSADPRIEAGHSLGEGTKSAVAVPLKVRDKVLGVGAAVSKQMESLSGDHLRLLTAYAAQASLALENALLYQEVKGQASTDQLTGLYNRRHFDIRFAEEMRRAKRYSHPLSLLFLDVNRLKVVNDRYGHLQGDALLRHVGNLLVKLLRITDVAARYGGDEFVALLPETSGEEACSVAERILRDTTPCPLLSGGSIPWGVSIGVSWVSAARGYDEDLLLQADEASYRAKREGTGWALAGEE
ncbi:MAG: diguanylate cyclase [Dehalococcoidia bacterium]|nr:diguanylate cyclase [Dehalococcoidia bacterium]